MSRIPTIWLAEPRYSKISGTIVEIRMPKFRLPTSSLAILAKNPELSGYLVAIMIKPNPSIKQMFATFDPKTLPTETPIVCGLQIENMATKSSGREVEKATSINPIFVFPMPVALARLIELEIAILLALANTTNEATRIAMLPTIPICSSTFSSPFQ